MKKSIILLFIGLSVFLSAQNSLEGTFQEAITAYESNDFAQALELFTNLENEGLINPDLHYNIGNCHFRLGHIGQAILYYKRALKERSNHEAARRNLNYALTFTQDKQGTDSEDVVRSFWKKTYDALSINLLAILVAVFFVAIVFIVCLMILRYRNREKTIPIFIMVILVFFFAAFTLLSVLKWHGYHSARDAVLLAKSAIGYSGPSEDFTRVFTIHEGMIFEIERSENNWSLIKLSNGLGGWIQSSAFEKI